MRDQFVNINEKEKFLLWTPMRTGSKFINFIFKHFDFRTLHYRNQEILKSYDFLVHNHVFDIVEGYEEYRLICSIRNPYSRFISYIYYLNFHGLPCPIDDTIEKTIYEYEKKIEDEIIGINTFKPDFFIRTESIYEDMIKIDFIKDSKLNSSGLLLDLSKKVMNSVAHPDWRSFYNEELAQKVYKCNKHIFDLGIYDKLSWKNP